MRRTEHFGGKLLGVGKSNFAKRNELSSKRGRLKRGIKLGEAVSGEAASLLRAKRPRGVGGWGRPLS